MIMIIIHVCNRSHRDEVWAISTTSAGSLITGSVDATIRLWHQQPISNNNTNIEYNTNTQQSITIVNNTMNSSYDTTNSNNNRLNSDNAMMGLHVPSMSRTASSASLQSLSHRYSLNGSAHNNNMSEDNPETEGKSFNIERHLLVYENALIFF